MYEYPGVLWGFKIIWECNKQLKAIAVAVKMKLLENAGLIKIRHKFYLVLKKSVQSLIGNKNSAQFYSAKILDTS